VKPVSEVDWIGGDVAVWHGFDPGVCCECASTAVLTNQGWVIFDPLPLSGNAWEEIMGVARVRAIALTSGNHQRESLTLRKTLQTSIHAPESAEGEIEADVWFHEGDVLAGFSLVDLPGAAPGEAAWCDGRHLVVGDALIHSEQLGFLPGKYCSNSAELRKSVRKLLDVEFDSVFFAHGLPLLSGAHEEIAALFA
jgi:hypothetical protein